MGVIEHDRQTGVQRLKLLAALGDRIREIEMPASWLTQQPSWSGETSRSTAPVTA
jgi:hypothetical protein